MTASLREAAQMALDALEIARDAYDAWGNGTVKINAAIEDLRAALAAPEDEPLVWAPIETAPKDESVILLGYTPHPRIERRVYEGRWHDAQQTWTGLNGFILHSEATHWMPLPPAPGAVAPQPAPVERKPLTDEQILNVARDHYNPHQQPEISFARAIEQAHGIQGAA